MTKDLKSPKRGYLENLKTSLDALMRDSPALLSLGCPKSIATIDGIEQQCKIAIGHGYQVGSIFISSLVSESDFTFGQIPVEWTRALTLIKTMKKRQ